jgi:hypothetical protein
VTETWNGGNFYGRNDSKKAAGCYEAVDLFGMPSKLLWGTIRPVTPNDSLGDDSLVLGGDWSHMT